MAAVARATVPGFLHRRRERGLAADGHDNGSEKRTSPRASIELKVDYKRLNSFFADYTKNISKGGTFIHTTHPLPIGTSFHFQISLPRRLDPFELLGEVAWVRQGSAEPGMGIRFLYTDDAQREQFERHVGRLMEEHLGPVLAAKLMGR
jgi:type IV pilus assembly protein PilZ